jgi:hypothetical protein
MRTAFALSWIFLLSLSVGCSAAADPPGDSEAGGSGAAASGGGMNLGGGGSSAGGAGSGNGGGLAFGGSGNEGGGSGGGECAGVSQQASNAVLPVDVIWTIDTSGSMTEETAAVRANMNAFSQQITAAGVDVRIVLVAEQYSPPPFPGFPDEGICIGAPLGSGKCPDDNKAPNFLHVFKSVGSTNSLSLVLQTYPNYKNALRPGSMKILTVVTDDNSALSAAAFTQQFDAIDPANVVPGLWKVYGIYCFSKCPSAAKQGTVYQQLVQQTQGVAGDLCTQNFKPVFDQLAAGVVSASKLSCGWKIPAAPAGETFDKQKVNVVFTDGSAQATTFGKVGSAADCGPNGGWHYDNEQNPTMVLVCPSTCQAIQSDPNGKIDVQFGCATKLAPPK